MIKIIDNLLPRIYFEELQNHFAGGECRWFFNDSLTGNDSFDSIGSFGFNMKLHWNGYFVDNYESILTKALVYTAQEKVEDLVQEPMRIVRVRGDMTVFNPLNHCHELHTDFEYEHMTAIFYMNTSDGNTLLYDREGKELIQEVEPIGNRLLIFDGMMQHTGHSPSKTRKRILINMNFMTPKLVEELNQKYGYHG